MRFKNYYNYEGGNRRIYTYEDILNMKMHELLDKEDAIAYQYRTLGMPNGEELESSPYTTKQENNWHALCEEPAPSMGISPIAGIGQDSIENMQRNYESSGLTNQLPEEELQVPQETGSGINMNILGKLLGKGIRKGVSAVKQNINERQAADEAFSKDYLGIYDEDNEMTPENPIFNNTQITGEAAPIPEEYQESFAPINNRKEYANENDDEKLNREMYIQNPDNVDDIKYPLQKVRFVRNLDYDNQTVIDKYYGLEPKVKAQKFISKIPIGNWSEKEYYGHASRLADGEKPSKFMKKNNDFTKISEIENPELRQIYIDKAVQMNKLDPNDPDLYKKVKDIDIVIPKRDSQLYNQIKKSEDFQKWVVENYDNIKNQKDYNESMVFKSSGNNDAKSLIRTIGKTDLKNAKVNEDGSFSVLQSDGYDFDYIDNEDSGNSIDLKAINNRAYKQQEQGQLRKYLLSTDINLSKEEIEEILRKFKK